MCAREPDNLRDPFAVAVVKSDAALGRTSLVSAPCGSGSLHPAYCASSRLKFSNRAMVVDARACTVEVNKKFTFHSKKNERTTLRRWRER